MNATLRMPFVGRTRELARLEALGESSLVTLWGPAGVGKTRLAREHAAAEARRGRVVAWADVSNVRTKAEILTAVAAALGVARTAPEVDADDELRALVRAAATQRALLVIDNVEQLDAEARATVARLAPAGVAIQQRSRRARRGARREHASVLVTSREPIRAGHEVLVPIEPLGEEDAIRLFEALAGPTKGEAASRIVRTIVTRLDAMPLAIELAASRVPLLGAAELLLRLDRQLDVLGRAKDSGPARHATLRAAIAWSWDLLDDEEREALSACATFEGAFEAGLAESVIRERPPLRALDRLESLRDRAMLQTATDARGRATLRLLGSVRDFVREAARANRDDDVWSRHAEAVVLRGEPLAEAARCGRDTLSELEALRADLVAASRRPGTFRVRATLALATLLAISGPASEAVERLDAVLENESGPPSTIARVLLAKGEALRALGRPADARGVLERAAVLTHALGETPEAVLIGADTARAYASVLRALGQNDEALASAERALAACRTLGDRAREGMCLGEIGAVHQSEGRHALARHGHADAIAIHVATGARRAEGVERSYLAVATHRSGEPAAAIALHEQALAIHREVGHRRLEGAELLHLGFVHHELGAIDAARDAFASARHVLAAAGAHGLEALAFVFAARLELDASDATKALLFLADAAQVAPTRWPRLTATRHLVEGHLAMATGAAGRARALYEAAIATSRHVEVGFELLTPAYLAVAVARTTAATATHALLEDARRHAAAIENPHLKIALAILAATACGDALPDVPGEASAASSEVRRALAFSGAQRALAVDDEARRLTLPDGRAVDLSRRKNVRLVLLTLARARRDAPGKVVLADALVAAGWPGERMQPSAATKRLHTAIWTLRSLGLDATLLTEGDGYLLDPRTKIALGDP